MRDYYDNRWHSTPIGPDDFVTAPTAMAVADAEVNLADLVAADLLTRHEASLVG